MITVVDKPKDTHVEQVRESLRKLGTPGTNEVLSLIIMAAGTLALISCPAARRPSRHIRARAGSTRKLGGLDSPIELENGKVTSGPDLSINVNGMQLPNPFVIGSGPPGTNYRVMKRAFDEGWGAVICKTICLDAERIHNVTPRYGRVKGSDGQTIGWENIELISDRPTNVMLSELKQLKEEYPDRILIASIMEEYSKDAWEEIVGRCEEVGVDGFEINFSCPHGMPEQRMGMAMGQNPDILSEVCSWVDKVATRPVWAKMTPNITDITVPARASLENGMQGISAINTIQSVIGINMETLRPEPCVAGYSTPGGYSSKAVKPIALAKCMAISQMIKQDYDDCSLSGIGGVEKGSDAAEFILVGASTVQVCTGVMLHGYPLVQNLCGGLQEFMKSHNFESVNEFRGASLPYFTTHHDLYTRQQENIKAKKAARIGLESDAAWTGDGFVQETESMVSN